MNLRDWFRLWFSLSEPVDRRAYAMTGFSLMALKVGVEMAIGWFSSGEVWTPFEYLRPRSISDWITLTDGWAWGVGLLFLWSLPFAWVGASMTLRRGLDAGYGRLAALCFFFPGVNYLWMLALCLSPTVVRDDSAEVSGRVEASDLRRVRVRELSAALPAVGLGVTATAICVFGFQAYGLSLFFATPFAMGMVAGYRASQVNGYAREEPFVAAGLSVVLTGGFLLLLGWEGILCLAMAFPPASVLALLGAFIGSAGGPGASSGRATTIAICAMLPLLMGAEALRGKPPLREVVSVVEIDAPPERVWPHVIGFSELPEPDRLAFSLGIAHPLRARIEGEGVGAVRYCEFSTGPFVEPITAWEPPLRLAFDVSSQPPTMHEWSPYEQINAPHLTSSLRSERGEFRLVSLSGGRTRLEGSTWYRLDMAPMWYWSAISDLLIHGIHDRVLEHVKELSEAAVGI